VSGMVNSQANPTHAQRSIAWERRVFPFTAHLSPFTPADWHGPSLDVVPGGGVGHGRGAWQHQST
jgi:hypothetical protein